MRLFRSRYRHPQKSVTGMSKGTPKIMAHIPLTLARCCSSCRISWAFCSTCSAPRRVSSRSMNTRYAARICSEGRDAQCPPPLSCGTPVPGTAGSGVPSVCQLCWVLLPLLVSPRHRCALLTFSLSSSCPRYRVRSGRVSPSWSIWEQETGAG